MRLPPADVMEISPPITVTSICPSLRLYSFSKHSFAVISIDELNFGEREYEFSNSHNNSLSELFICLLSKYLLLNLICHLVFFANLTAYEATFVVILERSSFSYL